MLLTGWIGPTPNIVLPGAELDKKDGFSNLGDYISLVCHACAYIRLDQRSLQTYLASA